MEDHVTLEAFILDQVYLFTCTAHEVDTLKAAVVRVNKEMNDVREHNKIRSRERIAVMASINLALVASHSASNTNTPEITQNLHSKDINSAEVLPILNQIEDTIDQGLKRLAAQR